MLYLIIDNVCRYEKKCTTQPTKGSCIRDDIEDGTGKGVLKLYGWDQCKFVF